MEIFVGVLTLVTLVFLGFQTVATNEQAKEAARQSKEAVKQSTAQRLDGLYEHLLARKDFLGSPDNAKVTDYVFRGTPLEDIKDEAERTRVSYVLGWELVYVDYLYEILPDLVDCAPADRHLVLRDDSPAEADRCDGWAAWSEYIYSVFTDKRQCQGLRDSAPTYGVELVSAIRATEVCNGIL
ncbi:hypothetical protein ACWDCB_03065 [Streptomyces sp. NPDC001178]